jgi:hypothetical protein
MGIWEHIAKAAFIGVGAVAGVYLRRKNPKYFHVYLLSLLAVILTLLVAWFLLIHFWMHP